MDAKHFDTLARAFSEAGSRRGLLSLLAAVPVLGGLLALLDPDEADARRRRKRRKKRHKHRKGRHKHKKSCKPKSKTTTCAGKCGEVKNNCKKNVNCGSCACSAHSDCGADALCLSDGSCQTCTVTCSGTPEECGSALQTALDDGGTVYLCPGAYQGGFTINAAVSVIGAGDGDDTASNTILDGNDAARAVLINSGTGTVELERLRITGGATSSFAAGIRHEGTTLRMRDCTVTGNTGAGGSSAGGISSNFGTTLELTRCTVSDNHAPDAIAGGIDIVGTTTLTDCLIEGNDASVGGGIYLWGGLTTLAGSTEVRGNTASNLAGGIYVRFLGTLVIAETCRVTNNTAPAGKGGGIFNDGGTVTLQGADPSPIVVANCVENCAGNVPKCAAGGTCPP